MGRSLLQKLAVVNWSNNFPYLMETGGSLSPSQESSPAYVLSQINPVHAPALFLKRHRSMIPPPAPRSS